MKYKKCADGENIGGKKNSFPEKIKYILRMAKKGSPAHIAVIAGVALVLCLAVAGVIFAFAGGEEEKENPLDREYDRSRDAIDLRDLGPTILEETRDAGQEYVDGTLFIGDSNTVRTMMYGHTTWDNVVAAVSMGVQHIKTLEMTYFKGYKKPVTVPRAVEIIQPQRIIITYGTNNLLGYTPEKYVEVYKEGLRAIHEAYPYADIIINAVPPIDKERENLNLTMQAVDKFNKALADMAREEGYKFLNSSEALKDPETGFAKKDYTIGDGVHLGKKGMEALFGYIRTHAYITEDRRPKPLNPVPEREETPTGVIKEDPLAVRGSRIRILFRSSDSELGTVDGEVEQKIKRTVTTSLVTAVPGLRAVFTGWSCSYSGLSSSTDSTVRFTVPKVDENVTEIIITANFERASMSITRDGSAVSSITLDAGQTAQLSVAFPSNYKGSGGVTWTSDNPAVASVDGGGAVTAVSAGKTVIRASARGGTLSARCEVTVTQPLEGIKISGNLNLMTGSASQLSVSFVPAAAGSGAGPVIWSSDNETVASVSPSGLVTANARGYANITASCGGKSDKVKVTVTRPRPLTGISLSGNTVLTVGERARLQVIYQPADTTDSRNASWSSDNPGVASVDGGGTVTANGRGSATITCAVGGFSASLTVTVTRPRAPPPDSSSETAPPVRDSDPEPPADSSRRGVSGENTANINAGPGIPVCVLNNKKLRIR